MTSQAKTTPWLTGVAIWALIAASATLNAWGWAQTPGVISAVLVVLAISAEILGARLFLHAEHSPALRGRTVLFVLAVGCVGFNAVSGHRAMQAAESQRVAPLVEAANAAATARTTRIEAEIAAATAEIAATPRCDLAKPGPQYQAACSAAYLAQVQPIRARIDALTASLDVKAPPIEGAGTLPDWLLWSIVVLIEALKALTFWGLSLQAAQRTTPVDAEADIEAEIDRRVARAVRTRQITEKRLATRERNKKALAKLERSAQKLSVVA